MESKPIEGRELENSRSGGYTLVELVVVMLVFGVVMSLISASFTRIVASSGHLIKSAETDIGGLIGLELLRVDLANAGFGLAWGIGQGVTYSEAGTHRVNGNPATDAAAFNDAPGNPPQAFWMADNKGVNSSDYLVLKGTSLARNDTCRSWSFLTYSSVSGVVKPSKAAGELVPGKGDRVIVVNSGMRGGEAFRELVTLGSTFWFTFDRIDTIPAAFLPQRREERYLVYGISPAPENADDLITFPFNRTDYYLGSSDRRSALCAPGTAVLYKATINQDGTISPMPILDCMADLQVIFMMDSSNDGSLTPLSDISRTTLKELFGIDDPAKVLREHVKEVRVYVLAQQGKKDITFNYPVADPRQVFVLGDRVNGKAWSQGELAASFGAQWQHYHWKVFTIAVQPNNLH
ncbi:MAG TPA: prepilin-type N-terminal cleavage/methylation domain-containing protein [Geomonas sp.]|nr:prepilin-type N-terminal cleavage/methylation domain-containing protein [Geomonas sp.]